MARAGGSPGGKLSGWLGGLSETELAELLRSRSDALLPPQPRSIGELASRLQTPYSVREALASLSGSGLLLLQAVLVLGKEADPERVHALFGGPASLPEARLAEELAGLRRLALVWPSGDRLASPGALRELIPNPLALGRPISQLLGSLTVGQLRRIGERYGLREHSAKAAWVAAVGVAITEPDTLRRTLDGLTGQARELAERAAWHDGEVVGVFLPPSGQRVPPSSPALELALRGWLLPQPWEPVGEMPREVALAVRGPDYLVLPSAPAPPTGQRVDPTRLLAAARSSGGSTVDGLNRLLAALEHAPLATVQAGGVGVRELGRVSKELRCAEPEVRLWLETAAAAGLVTVEDGVVLPTETAEGWRQVEPASAWACVVAAWWDLPVTPSHRLDEYGKRQPAMGGRLVGINATQLRTDLLDTLAGSGDSTAVSSLDAVVDLLVWRRPLGYLEPEILRPYAEAAWTEFRALGLLADDALTPLGAALRDAVRTDDPPTALSEAVAGLLPAPAGTATFLPDLTAVVAGTASVQLAALLDGCADAESRDVASTWRFGPSSIRRALDAGHTADELLADLAAVADRPLPQPLDYLVHDVARRHGQVRVRSVACCVCVPDPALAAELTGHRSLAALRLVSLADTVLASSKPVAETLAALRAAGYAPVREDATGATVVERAPRRLAKPPRPAARIRVLRPPAPDRPAPVLLRPEALAAALLRAASEPAALPEVEPLFDIPPATDAVLSRLRSAARQLSEGELAILADAIERGEPVRIDYLSASSGLTNRVVEPIELDQKLLTAWCRLRDDERNFVVGRIASVSSAVG